MDNIDWSEFTGPEDTCYCRCGEIFRSHTKYVKAVYKAITKEHCPRCGKDDDCWRILSDPETITIK